MKLIRTGDPQVKPSVVMLVYGEGGVGKTTFASTAPKVIIADCENGSKYFGLRGIDVPVALIENWGDMKEFLNVVRDGDFETIVIDPIGELMDKLKRFMIAMGDSKLVQKDGSPTMAGWGWLKKTLRDYLKVLRDTGLNIIIVAHLEEKNDEERIVKRPKVETKLSEELVAMVDIVAYMTVVQDAEGGEKRILIVDPSNDKYTAKDRTGRLGKVIEPDFDKIVKASQGTKTYSWCKDAEPAKPEATQPEASPVDPEDEPEVETAEVCETEQPKEETPVEPKNGKVQSKLDQALSKGAKEEVADGSK